MEVLGTNVWLVASVTLLSVYLFFKSRSKNTNSPPCYGWLPYIGCAVEFGKAPLLFIEEATRRFGSVFTLKVAGKRLTFLTDPEDFKHFFQSQNVDFQKAVQKPVQNTASVSVESFFENHTKIHDIVKGRLAPAHLDPFCDSLGNKFNHYLKSWGDKGSGDLNEMVRSVMYAGVLDNLFGEGILQTENKVKFQELEKHFVRFDEDFEYGSQLPGFFLKNWSESKHWLLNVFRKTVKFVENEKDTKETVFKSLIDAVDRPHAPNYGLLMMWASLANAIPITFWTLAFILSHPGTANEVREEIQKTLGGRDAAELKITQKDIEEMPAVKRCVLETIRLRSPGVITRGVAKSFTVKGFTIPEGDMLMLSPYWAHRNETFFPDPDSFKPERWKEADLTRNIFLDGFVAFGGGRYQCPGRWFALLEIQLIIVMILNQFDLQPQGKVPSPSTLHLVGTQQPDGGYKVNYTRKI